MADSRTLREQLRSLLRTDADLDAFCFDYFPDVHARHSAHMDRIARENLILSSVNADELAAALLQSKFSDLRWERGRFSEAPILKRAFDACRYREHSHSDLRIRLLTNQETELAVFAVSYQEHGFTFRFGLGIARRPMDQELLVKFANILEAQHLNTRFSRPSILLFVQSKGAPPLPPALEETARELGFALLSLDQYEWLLDLQPALARQNARLAADPRYPTSLYVPQSMRISHSPGLRRFEETTNNALESVCKWLTRPEARFVLILGDFGMGKTFLLREVARQISQADNHLIPLICELRQIEKARDLETLLVQYMQQERILPIDPQALRQMCRLGRVVLLFDGFDELALRTDYQRAAEHLETILQAVEGDARVLLTSRTQHFLTDKQVETVLMQRLERVPTLIGRLLPFDLARIQRFLENQLGSNELAKARYSLFHEAGDLFGLACNPRMLSFLTEIPPESLMQNRRVTSANLYQMVIDNWIDFEIQRKTAGVAGQMLTREQLFLALEELALSLWRQGTHSVRLAELEQASARLLENFDSEPGIAAQQLGSSSLLCRDPSGRFSFLHQSLVEWFIARAMSVEILRGKHTLFAERTISSLAAEFLLGFLGEAAATALSQKLFAESTIELSSATKQNALALVACLNEKQR